MKKIFLILCLIIILPIASVRSEDKFEYAILTIWEMNSKDYSKINNGFIITFESASAKKIYVEKASTKIPNPIVIQHYAFNEFLKKIKSKILSESKEKEYNITHILTELGFNGWKLIQIKSVDKSDKLNRVIKTSYYFIRKNFEAKTNNATPSDAKEPHD